MTQHDLLNLIEEGLENGRLSPSLAAFIAADLLGVEPEETGYGDWVDLVIEADESVAAAN
jgi:hypothetical protein